MLSNRVSLLMARGSHLVAGQPFEELPRVRRPVSLFDCDLRTRRTTWPRNRAWSLDICPLVALAEARSLFTKVMESRKPTPALLPFVSRIWASEGSPRHAPGVSQERVLPSGAMHLVLRLDSSPLRVFERGEERALGPALVGGARSNSYVKDVTRPVPSVGVVLEAGAALALFGVPASDLAGTHTPLDLLWGRDADRLADELVSLSNGAARLARFESFLATRLPNVRGIHPGVARVLEGSRDLDDRASALAERAGLGPRRFAQLFRDAVGVSPKRWLRLRRFQRTLGRAEDPDLDWADVAYELGYSDQPHLAREFREFSGLTPGEYRRLAPRARNHVPVDPADSRGPISSRRG
jgi:AraC-like DNA-binding protein